MFIFVENENFVVKQDKAGSMLIQWKSSRGKSVFLQGDDAKVLEDEIEACGDSDKALEHVLSAYVDVMI